MVKPSTGVSTVMEDPNNKTQQGPNRRSMTNATIVSGADDEDRDPDTPTTTGTSKVQSKVCNTPQRRKHICLYACWCIIWFALVTVLLLWYFLAFPGKSDPPALCGNCYCIAGANGTCPVND